MSQTELEKQATQAKREEAQAANRDPISGAPGSHPVGTALGAAAGGAAGALGAAAVGGAMGAVVGPAGAVAGAAIGAVVGGLAGKAAGEAIDPTVETAYWREQFPSRPYASAGKFEDYEPAYSLANRRFADASHKTFEEVEPVLEREWPVAAKRSPLAWQDARNASRDAWDRLRDPARDPAPVRNAPRTDTGL